MFGSCVPDRAEKGVLLELPIKLENGYRPFEETYSALSNAYSSESINSSPWILAYPEIKGVPGNWHNVVRYTEWLDARQFIYQTYQAGIIHSKLYNCLNKSWIWADNEVALSKKPIKCYINIIRGQDKWGNTVMRIDSNNDLDFSNETSFYPQLQERAKKNNVHSITDYNNANLVWYESVRNGKIIRDSIPMVIKYEPGNGIQYWCSFPQYGLATMHWKGRDYCFAVSRNFSSTSFYEARIIEITSRNGNKKQSFLQAIQKGGFLEIGPLLAKSKFRYIGVKQSANVLLLESVSL